MTTILLIALALCVDSLVVSAAVALGGALPWRRALFMAAIFAFCQGLLPLLGALLGVGFQSLMTAVDHWISFGLMLWVGGKMILDALRGGARRRMETVSVGMMFMLGVATSIDAFVVGVGLALAHDWYYMLTLVVVVAVATLLLSLAGSMMGRYRVPIPERLSSVVAGLVLIGMGTYTLCSHLMTGC